MEAAALDEPTPGRRWTTGNEGAASTTTEQGAHNLMPAHSVTEYNAAMREGLVEFLNDAYADIRALKAVAVEGRDYPPFTTEQTADRVEQGERILAIADGEAVVSAIGWAPAGEGVCSITFIATSPARRRQGHAAALLAECGRQARAEGMTELRTGPFVDSRYEPACRLFEACGFEVRDPTGMNITMETDIAAWTPREPELPDGYNIVPFRDGDEQAWVDLQKAVFGGNGTEEWFRQRFRDRPNFDPDGWFFLERDGRRVGITGAIVWFEDEAMTRPAGALMEWVGVVPEERGNAHTSGDQE